MKGQNITSPQIIPLKGLNARYEPVAWDFAENHRSDIDAHWQKLITEKPAMFNGTVLMQHRFAIEDGIYNAAYTPVDYASFTAWIKFGQPGAPRRNGFAMGALRSTDGAFLLGVMGSHTFNAGKIYFPGGTPDMGDVTEAGIVDLATSVTRELREETGIRTDEIIVDDTWTVVLDGFRCAFLKPVTLQFDAKTARQMIMDRLASDTDQELSDIAIVRSINDLDEAKIPAFVQAYIKSIFASEA
jgi:8-oxo-dGTP pyrophosphatase MutT (NUDIX family)